MAWGEYRLHVSPRSEHAKCVGGSIIATFPGVRGDLRPSRITAGRCDCSKRRAYSRSRQAKPEVPPAVLDAWRRYRRPRSSRWLTLSYGLRLMDYAGFGLRRARNAARGPRPSGTALHGREPADLAVRRSRFDPKRRIGSAAIARISLRNADRECQLKVAGSSAKPCSAAPRPGKAGSGLMQNVSRDRILTLQGIPGRGEGCVIDAALRPRRRARALSIRRLFSAPWGRSRPRRARPPSSPAAARRTAATATILISLGKYYQFQVILKPVPAGITDLYQKSLKAIGLDPKPNTTSAGSRTTWGIARRSALPAWVGEVWLDAHGDHSIHLFPADGLDALFLLFQRRADLRA